MIFAIRCQQLRFTGRYRATAAPPAVAARPWCCIHPRGLFRSAPAARHRCSVSPWSAKLAGADTGEDLRQTLRILGSTASSELMALEVIWQPEGRGDVLSANDLVTAYPNLQHL